MFETNDKNDDLKYESTAIGRYQLSLYYFIRVQLGIVLKISPHAFQVRCSY